MIIFEDKVTKFNWTVVVPFSFSVDGGPVVDLVTITGLVLLVVALVGLRVTVDED